MTTLSSLASFVFVFLGFLAGSGGAPMPETSATQPPDRAVVLFVYDGDTVLVRIGSTTERVRYIGVDAPERAYGIDEVGECFAEDAYEANRSLTLGREVLLVRDERNRDTHDRLLRYVHVGERAAVSVGEQLVRGGYARALPVPPDLTRAEQLTRVEHEAREVDAGLWGACT